MAGGFGDKAPGGDLLLHGLSHTTIGAGAFHCRVRDGIGWYHTAMAAREGVESSPARKELSADSHGDLGRNVWAAHRWIIEAGEGLESVEFLQPQPLESRGDRRRVAPSMGLWGYSLPSCEATWGDMVKPHGSLVLVS